MITASGLCFSHRRFVFSFHVFLLDCHAAFEFYHNAVVPDVYPVDKHFHGCAINCGERITLHRLLYEGMARGVDIWAAEVVLRLRDNGAPIHLIAASPYQGFERAWSSAWQSRYASALAGADIVRFISPQYDRGCFQRRNEWMVDHAGRVIAVFNGEKGGTKNTIDYAERQNIPVIYIP